ncbi:MAG: phosphatase PAP2 family protein [Atopobiaceae bacterium]|jgi:membrane-associated phospholipid phosphatase|nr:phosphatase PAP2 family protein [Atopobiaceae bacterium]MCH4229859.1 phosphatase PAP2 family protein [Atopobiaceae bacterium]MCH4277014.1 phosphatase PAP2 family protein [Atopobiaceae bacterium]MCI1226126.1 phosphatase PAP2 family protein [Atopobiaceae bacterium]MDD2588611.1 phosphatase PAP2 family protein [Atopobiaceae bacterium]
MDIDYLLMLQGVREATGGVFDAAIQTYSDVGLVVFGILVPLLVFWCIDTGGGWLSLLSYTTGSTINQLLKNVCCVYRPWIRSSELHPVQSALAKATGYSFPSGHVSGTSSAIAALAVWWRKKKAVVAACVVVIALMMFSRNWLGVHTPQDVLVGLLVGITAVLVVRKVLAWVDDGAGRDLTVLLVGYAICAAILVFLNVKSYPMDYVNGELLVDPAKMVNDCYSNAGLFMGVLGSWFVDRRLVRYSCEGSVAERVVRGLVGSIIVMGIYLGALDPIVTLMGAWVGRFVGHLLLCVVGLIILPLLFTKTHEAWERHAA